MARRALITSNLESAFREARATARPPPRTRVIIDKETLPDGIPPHLVQAMVRRAQTGGNIDRVGQFRYNPFLQATNLDIPSDLKIRHQYMRHFVRTNALVGAAIELHSEFPLSGFHIEHEDPAIEEFLEGMGEETDLLDFTILAAAEYWTIGEFFPFGFFDDVQAPTCWTGFVLLDPDKTLVQGSPWIRGPKKERVSLVIDNITQKIIDQGPRHPLTGPLYSQLPDDIVAAGKARRPLELSPLQVSHVKRGGAFSVRGESIIERVFPLLMYKSKLREAQYLIADRHITPTEIWKIGESNDPADNEELEAFREQLASTYNDVNRSIVWHHALQYQVEGATGKIMPIWQEMDAIDNEVLAGLLLNKSLIMGDSSTFASDVVRYDILVNRYMLFRKRIEKWLLRSIYAPILRIHEMYVPEHLVKSLQYRRMSGKGRPLSYPTLRWEKQNLRDDAARVNLLVEMAAKGLVPYDSIYPLINLDPRKIHEQIDDEIEKNFERKKKLAKKLQMKGFNITMEQLLVMDQGAAPVGGGGSPLDIGGGELPSFPTGPGGAPPGMPGGPTGGLPEVVPGTEDGATAPVAGGLPGAPAESFLPVGIPTQ